MSNTKAWLSYCSDEDELLAAVHNLEAGYTLEGDQPADDVHRRATWKTLALHSRPITDRVFAVFAHRPWLYDQLMLNPALGPGQARKLLGDALQSLRKLEESTTRDVLAELVSSSPAEFSLTTLVQALEAYHRRFNVFPGEAREQIVSWIGKLDGSRDWTIENIRAHLLDVMIGVDMEHISTAELIEFFHARQSGAPIHLARLMDYQAASVPFFEHVLDSSSLPGSVVVRMAGRECIWSSPELRGQLIRRILECPAPASCKALLGHTHSTSGFRRRFQALSSEYPEKALEVLEEQLEADEAFLAPRDLVALLSHAPKSLRPRVLRAAAHLSR